MAPLARIAAVLALAVSAVGCGGETTAGDGGEYPLVAEPEPQHGPEITTPSGAIVRRPLKPTRYRTEPSATCERILATFHDGSKPTRRPIVIPPMPGVRASAVSERDVLIEWTFHSLPRDCRPETILLSVVANDDPGSTPTTKLFELDGESGSAKLTYPDFLPPPDVAHASASTDPGRRSRTASVLIRR